MEILSDLIEMVKNILVRFFLMLIYIVPIIIIIACIASGIIYLCEGQVVEALICSLVVLFFIAIIWELIDR